MSDIPIVTVFGQSHGSWDKNPWQPEVERAKYELAMEESARAIAEMWEARALLELMDDIGRKEPTP